MENTTEHGRPGGYASALAARRARPVLVAVVVASMTGGAAAAASAAGRTGLAAAFVTAAVAAAAAGRARAGGVRRARRGAQAEAAVAAALRRCGARRVVHGALIGGGGDADHVLLGPYLAVVETKAGVGHVSASENGVSVAGRSLPGDPVRQARRQAAALGRIVGGYADAVVCVPGMANPPVRVGDTVVCSASDLPGVVVALPRRIGTSLADTVAERAAEGAYATRSDR